MKKNFKYNCEECGREYEISKDLMLCPSCREQDMEGKPLKGVLKVMLPREMENSKKPGEFFDIFDYLPVEKEFFPQLPVGNTPFIKADRIEQRTGIRNVYLKFDGTNPTGSFKDRASYLVSAFAKKHGLNEIVLASTGNAASSMSGIGASAGQKIYVFMPSTAPKAKLVQCMQYGATLVPIKGNYDKAFDLSLKFSERTGILNRNTAFNPMTIEGKKTVSYELCAQMKGADADYVFVPTGDGVIIDGVIKGFNDLKYLGLISRIPKIVACQAEESSFIYKAFHYNDFDLSYRASTIADSISVDAARNGYSAVKSLKSVKGDAVTASDKEILEAQKYLSSNTGIFTEPSSAVAYACMLNYLPSMTEDSTAVLLLTGHGLKDIENASRLSGDIEIFEPDLNEIMEKLKI
ncbi:MAG: threonine synthase [Syntrophothermus sp.]